MNNDLMIEKYYECIGNDLKEEGEKELAMQWLGVWIEAWRACVRTLSPSQLAADLETARRGLAEYRATIERMVAEKEEMAGKLAELAQLNGNQKTWLEEYKRRETTEIEGWVSAINTEHARLLEVYEQIASMSPGYSTEPGLWQHCFFCNCEIEQNSKNHALDCLWARAQADIAGEKP